VEYYYSLIERVERQKLLEDFSLRSLANLARQKHLVDDRVDFVEVEHQIQLANIVKVFVQHFHEIVNGFEITQVVIVHVHTDAEIEASIAAINDFEVAELRGKSEILLAKFGM
jgi:hypothetical protein